MRGKASNVCLWVKTCFAVVVVARVVAAWVSQGVETQDLLRLQRRLWQCLPQHFNIVGSLQQGLCSSQHKADVDRHGRLICSRQVMFMHFTTGLKCKNHSAREVKGKERLQCGAVCVRCCSNYTYNLQKYIIGLLKMNIIISVVVQTTLQIH